MDHFDVAIIGASLAGSTTAYLLARQGFTVALCDKSRFPRSKPCGEGLSHIGCTLLKTLGLGERLQALEHAPFDGFCIIPSGTRKPLSLKRRRGPAGIGVERRLLDSAILQAASAQPSVVSYLGERADTVVPAGKGWCVRTPSRLIRSRSLVLADGLLSPTSAALGLRRISKQLPRHGMRVFLDCKKPHGVTAVTIFVHRDREWFCTPVSPTRLNLSLLAHSDTVANLRRGDKLTQEISPLCESLCVDGEVADEISGRGPFSRRSELAATETVFLVGDACEAFDPRCGMGMTHALLGSQLAVRLMAGALLGRMNWRQAAALYCRQTKVPASAMRTMDWLTGWIFRRVQESSRLLPLLRKAPVIDLTHTLLALTCPDTENEVRP